jgi:hypothetical protein
MSVHEDKFGRNASAEASIHRTSADWRAENVLDAVKLMALAFGRFIFCP